MTDFAIVSTTVESEKEAQSLARALVEDRLAACVQILPVRSIYRWKDNIEDAGEHLLLCKVAVEDFAAIEAAISRRHAYDVPEILMMPITAGHAPYLEWVADSTARDKRNDGAPSDTAAKK